MNIHIQGHQFWSISRVRDVNNGQKRRHGVLGSALASLNEVDQHRARLLLGWVTVCGHVRCLGM